MKQLDMRAVAVNDRCFGMPMMPDSEVILDLGMERFVNQPGYAFPWSLAEYRYIAKIVK